MKMMFVWEYVDGLTGNWHDGGGCLVIADNMEVARELLKCHVASKDSGVFKNCPNYSAPVEAVEDKVFIFPDAGCC